MYQDLKDSKQFLCQRKQRNVIILLALCNKSDEELKWHEICQNLGFESVFAGLSGRAWTFKMSR